MWRREDAGQDGMQRCKENKDRNRQSAKARPGRDALISVETVWRGGVAVEPALWRPNGASPSHQNTCIPFRFPARWCLLQSQSMVHEADGLKQSDTICTISTEYFARS
jgi:hypothetical protein